MTEMSNRKLKTEKSLRTKLEKVFKFLLQRALISGVAKGSAARGGSRNCRPQMQWCTQDLGKGGGNITGGLGA